MRRNHITQYHKRANKLLVTTKTFKPQQDAYITIKNTWVNNINWWCTSSHVAVLDLWWSHGPGFEYHLRLLNTNTNSAFS